MTIDPKSCAQGYTIPKLPLRTLATRQMHVIIHMTKVPINKPTLY